MSQRSERILLLVPHPDDEVVGCATAIARSSARFFALYLTTGVPEDDWPWRRAGHPQRVERRRREALAAAAALGIEPLGFCPWPSRSLRLQLGQAKAQIEAAIAAHAIDVVWAPAYEGGHQDHDATSFLASALARPVIEYAEYNARGAQAFPAPTGAETILRLTAAEAATKKALLRIYRSEALNLSHVECQQEALRPLARYDYGRPPHEGRLFYQRFHWLPFHHPRVDFTPPAQVCQSFARFEGQKGWTTHG